MTQQPFAFHLSHALSSLVAGEPNWWSESLIPSDREARTAPEICRERVPDRDARLTEPGLRVEHRTYLVGRATDRSVVGVRAITVET